MASFNDAVQKVLKAEGGFVNHPNDRGGPTNWGITQRVYDAWMAKNSGNPNYKSTIAEIQKMPVGNAITIYKEQYWNPIQGDKIKKFSMAAMIFDQAVNAGVRAAVIRAQRVLGLREDGVMGPQTLAAINGADEATFLKRYYDETVRYYNAIVANNPSQAVFINGWLKRADSLYQYGLSYFGISNTTAVGIGLGFVAAVSVGGFFLYKYLKQRQSAPRAAPMVLKAA